MILASVAGLQCGSEADPVCGNGVVESGEQCDDGNTDNADFCRNTCIQNLPDTLDATIQWAFNKNAAPQFDTDGCLDMGVSRVEVTIAGPETRTLDESCALRQVVFLDLAGGTYVATLLALDSDGNLMTTAPREATFVVTTLDVAVEVVIGYEDWLGDYTGTFFFRTAWGGADCAAAAPPVAQHRLLLEREGGPLSGLVTDVGDPIDGSAPGPCRSNQTAMEEFPQSALLVPWGPAEFTVVGVDTTGVEQFRETFATFVGAGVNNPEMLFDVNSLAPDAGVPDAGVPDAGVPDA
jgi:cysteine-rich repeat protein